MGANDIMSLETIISVILIFKWVALYFKQMAGKGTTNPVFVPYLCACSVSTILLRIVFLNDSWESNIVKSISQPIISSHAVFDEAM